MYIVEGIDGCTVKVQDRQSNRQDSVQAQSHRMASNKDGGNA